MLRHPRPPLSRAAALGLLALAATADAATLDFASPHATYPTGAGPQTVAIGRLDADAAADLAVGNGTGRSISILLNHGDGTFAPRTDLALPGVPLSVAIVDLDGDGHGDVVVANQAATGLVSIFMGRGDGTFLARVDYPAHGQPIAMRVVDADGDGELDVLTGGTNGIDFFKGGGDGTLSAAAAAFTGSAVSSLAVGDLDGDGRIDIAAVIAAVPAFLLGHGDGTFAAPLFYSSLTHALSIGIGDFDGDGRNDVAVTDYAANAVSILPNSGGGSFGVHRDLPTGRQPKSLMPVDLDGDGKLDLVYVDVMDASIGFLRGDGAGGFAPQIAYSTGAAPYVDAVGDLDGDGRPDVVAVNSSASTVSVLLQGTGAAPAAVTDLAAGGIGETTVTLSWTTPLVESRGPETCYVLRYGTSPITAGNFAAAAAAPTPPVGLAGTAAAATVTGLAPLTSYYFALETTDAQGRPSALSDLASATTTSDLTPPGTVADLAVGAVGDHHAVLTWTAPGDDGTTGTAASYDLRMSTAPIDVTSFATATAVATGAPRVAGSGESAIATGLAAGTAYYFALRTSDEVPLVSAMSNVTMATTAASDTLAPAQVTDLVATGIAGGVTLTWTAPGDDGGIGTAAGYQLRYATTPIASPVDFAAATAVAGLAAPRPAGGAEQVTVSGLAPGTAYWFALVARDEVPNQGAMSDVASATPTAPAAAGDDGPHHRHCGLGSGIAGLLLVVGLARLRRQRRC